MVNVSWEDAQKFCLWLSEKEGATYRLPSDHEWSCAVGVGKEESPTSSPSKKTVMFLGRYPWGSRWPPPDGAGNYAGGERTGRGEVIAGYRDLHSFTAPVGSYAVNKFGLCDLEGNVWEWCTDLFKAGGKDRVLRGGSWRDAYPGLLLMAHRFSCMPDLRFDNIGFRIVRVIESKN